MSPPLSLTGKRWIIREGEERSGETVIENLARQRRIDLAEVPSWEKLSDPMLLGEMPAAVERLRRAIKARESVGIIGDYDADGITGVAQLVRFFRRHTIEPHIVLPHRERHGYGVKRGFIDALAAKRVTLLLTVDTGISAVTEIAYARTYGMDVIVCDHHALPASQEYTASHAFAGELPDAIIVHPSLPTANCQLSTVNCRHLSGSGVVFTLLRALENDFTAAKHGEAGWGERGIDIALAAIGTVGDVVPLLGENRTIVALGIEALNQALCAGTGQAMDAAAVREPLFELARSILGNEERLKSSHLAYRIAPRINAAGRIADPSLSLKVLLEGGPYLQQLHTLNERRQLMTEKMMEIGLREIDEESPVLACASPFLHIGIIGLLASKLTSRYGRPSVVGHEKDHLIMCSLRSVPSYNIIQALGRCAEHLLSFGGHEMAAGCTLEKSGWRAFIHAFSSDAANILGEEPRAPTLRIDALLTPQEITAPFVRALEALEPFGAGNPEPLFLLEKQRLASLRCVGRDAKHFQCTLGGLRAVGFGLGHLLQALPQEADIACQLRLNSWNGTENMQIVIEDIAVSTPLTRIPGSSRGAKEKSYIPPPR